MEPTIANGPTLDTQITKNREQVAEREPPFTAGGYLGTIRALGILNCEDEGTFREALLIRYKPDLEITWRVGPRTYVMARNL
jgi:hypothetical protein